MRSSPLFRIEIRAIAGDDEELLVLGFLKPGNPEALVVVEGR